MRWLVYQSSYRKRFQNANFCYLAVITTNFSALTAGRDVTKLAGREITDGLMLQFTPLSHVKCRYTFMLFLCLLLFRNQMKLFVNKFYGSTLLFSFLQQFFGCCIYYLEGNFVKNSLRVAILAMLNIMMREQAVLNWKNAS